LRSLLLVCVGAWLGGCEWRAPQPPVALPQGLDLSSLAEGTDGWYTRQVDKGRLPRLDTHRVDQELWLSVVSRKGVASRWRRKVRWPAEDYPILEWSWTPGGKVDSVRFSRRKAPATVVAVDVTLASSFGIHKTIRYLWSARMDRHVQYQRDAWHPKVVVLRDASDAVGVPLRERVNVWQDFQRLWGESPRHQALSISVFAHQPDTSKTLTARFGRIVAVPMKENP
jgi:hypothetical protein